MVMTETRTLNLKEVEETISKAIKKVGVKKENDLCRYLPMTNGGYMHHFTLKKMKRKNPSALYSLIKMHILENARPIKVPPKQRATRGLKKKHDQLTFTRTQLERMLNIARLAGDKEIISVLSPKKSLATYKRELIQAIRKEEIGPHLQELINSYIESIQSQRDAALKFTQFANSHSFSS